MHANAIFFVTSKKLNDTCIVLLPAKFYGNILVNIRIRVGGGGGGGKSEIKELKCGSEDNLC